MRTARPLSLVTLALIGALTLTACNDAEQAAMSTPSSAPATAASDGSMSAANDQATDSGETQPGKPKTANPDADLPGYDEAEIEAFCRGRLMENLKDIWASNDGFYIDEEAGSGYYDDGKHPGGCWIKSCGQPPEEGGACSQVLTFDVYPFPYIEEPDSHETTYEEYTTHFEHADEVHRAYHEDYCIVKNRLRYCVVLPRQDASEALLTELVS